MTKFWRERSYKWLSEAKEGKPTEAADQRILNVKASIVYISAEVENDWQESAKKLAQIYEIEKKGSHHSSQGSEALKKVCHACDRTALWANEEGVSGNAWSDRGDNHWDFLTILDNSLTVCESAGTEEQSGWLKGAGKGTKNGCLDE